MAGFDAVVTVDVDATPEAVWQMLTTRASEVWLGATVTSDWRTGSTITWAGEWDGKPFEDHGEITTADAPRRLVHTHVSPTSPDAVHTLAFTLTPTSDGGTHVELVQDGNSSKESAEHSSGNLQKMLDAVKSGAEG